MYCKLFTSLYQGTLRGKSHEILVFTNLLATCDKEGFVDKHFRAISEEVGLTIDEVKSAIQSLEAPDPESRSQDLNGSRLERLEGHRDWGWRIVNYVKYSSIKDMDERREYQRVRQAEYRSKKRDNVNCHKVDVTDCDKPHLSQKFTHVDVNVAVDGNVNAEEKRVSDKPKPANRSKISTDEFLQQLAVLYGKSILDAEIVKMKAWLISPKGTGRKLTHQFIVNWMNRVDVTINQKTTKDLPPGFQA